MKPHRIIVLAGHQRSLATVALVAALARMPRDAFALDGVISVSPFSMKRIRNWRRRFGPQMAKKVLSQFGLARRGPFADETAVYTNCLDELGVGHRSLRPLCRELDVPLQIVRDIHGVKSIAFVRRHRPDLAVYSGAGILRGMLIDAIPDGVLNLHCGPLPHVRGMNAVEWSLYLGIQPEVTLHKVDRGIDTGAILASQTVAVRPAESLGTIRARTVVAGIDLLLRELPHIDGWRTIHNPPRQGRQYFTMAEPLKQVVQAWLDQGITPVGSSDEIDPDDTRPAPLRAKAA